jgi:hypothetical protein
LSIALIPDAAVLADAGDETTWRRKKLVGLHRIRTGKPPNMEEEARATNLVERSRADLLAEGSSGGFTPSLGYCYQYCRFEAE